MNCKRCGSPLTENDQFCKSCGAAANESLAQQNTVNEQSTVQTEQPVSGYNSQPTQNVMGGQPQNNFGQQGWANGYNTQPNYNQAPQKNNSNVKYIILGVVILVAIIAVVFIVSMFTGNNDNSSLSGNGNNNPTNVNSKSSYKVNFKGFTFNIPDNLIYEEDNGVLLIGDESGTWMTQIELEQGNFSQLKANKAQLQSAMQQNGFASTAAELKNLGGVEYITLELTASGQKAIAALAKANSMYFISVTAMNQDNEFDYSLLETIAPIISSASYSGSTNNMEVRSNLNMSGLAELAK